LSPAGTEALPARRVLILVWAASVAVGLVGFGWAVLAAGGWTVWEALILVCLGLNAPWLGLGAATGLVGFGLRLLHHDDLAAGMTPVSHCDTPPAGRTIIAVCVRLEDMQATLPPLDLMLRQLGTADGRFVVAVLSDTPDGPAATAEAAAVGRFAAAHPPGAVRYRRRQENTGFKAGNVMEFLDHHAAGFDYLLLLDADSRMSAATVRRLVAAMAAEPGMAIVQPTIAAHGEDSAFARLFGFGHRHGTRIWATGQAWWQGPQGAYWGHNALLRIAPFRARCRLPTLPDGSAILSHDLVEAARLHAAGWAVRVLPDDRGSTERHPPDLPALLDRDVRWAAGNLQFRHLLRARDLSRVGRLQMLQAMAHYALAPLWFAPLPLAAINAATGGGAGTPRDALIGLLALGFALLHLPKLLGYAEAVLRPLPDCPRPSLPRVLQEMVFSLLLDSLAALDRSAAATRLLAGRLPGWAPQRRDAGGIGWREAWQRFWPHTLVGAALLLAFAAAGWFAMLVALPALLGLLLAVPFCVLTGRPDAAAIPARRAWLAAAIGR